MRRALWIPVLMVSAFAAAPGVAHGAASSKAEPSATASAAPAASAGGPDLVRAAQWQLGVLDVAQAHRLSTGTGIVVAVLDSGVDASHPDLAGQVLPSPGSVAATDRDGRGTALAGLIAGHGHGPSDPTVSAVASAGILGIAPGAKILPVAFAPEPLELGEPDELAKAIDYAVAQRADIICVGRGLQHSPRLQAAVAVAIEHGVMVIAADGDRLEQPFSPWPASYPGVLTAVAVDRYGTVPVAPASGRSTGIAVPGVDLISTGTGGGYRIDGGTSAAAVLAGAAALVWSAHPDASAKQITHRLRATVHDLGAPGPGSGTGTGALDLGRALTQRVPDLSPEPSPDAAADPSPQPAVTGAAVTVALLDSGDWRRWLVTLPLVSFLIGLVTWAVRTGRAQSRGLGPEVR